jgi:glycosyltransferase involved in cell wall biosynthesis
MTGPQLSHGAERSNSGAPSICAVILTQNEEKHLARCIASIQGVVSRIVVVDSGSSDKTRDIALAHGADIYFNPWKNYSTQFNWALDNTEIKQDWCLRIDADEFLTQALSEDIKQMFSADAAPADVSGYSMNRIMVFMDRKIRWGGLGDLYMLRLFRTAHGRCEQRWMDEHITLSQGATRKLKGELVDHNLNNIGWWITKHNGYSTREAIDILNIKYGFEKRDDLSVKGDERQAARKRWIKENIYAKLPVGVRALIYFLWRLVFKFGFLDGRPGLVFHFLQGFWYRALVDVKAGEIEEKARSSGRSIPEVIEAEYGYVVRASEKDGAKRVV